MKKILVVDDESEIRKLLNFALRKSFLIEEAQDADSALEMIQFNRPTAILLDVMMQGKLNGFELCARIKNDPELAGIYVVMITARGQIIEQELGHSIGADAYFVKPFSPQKLEQHLLEALIN